MPSPTPIYRPLLKKALRTAWFHRELWPLAAVAGIAGTGTVMNDLLAQGKSALSFADRPATDTLGIINFFNFYFSQMAETDIYTIFSSFFFFIGLAVLVVCVVVGAQHAILRTIHRAANKKEHFGKRELLNELKHPRFGRLISLNFLFKLLSMNLMIAVGILLRELNTSTVLADAIFGAIFAGAAIALSFSINVIAVLSLINVTKNNAGLFEAVEEALKTLRGNPVVCLEMSTLLFACNFLFTAGYLAVILLSATPVILLFSIALNTGSLFVVSVIGLLSILFTLTFTIACAGFLTTFTYSAWTELSYKLARAPLKPRLHLHGKRMLAHFAKTN